MAYRFHLLLKFLSLIRSLIPGKYPHPDGGPVCGKNPKINDAVFVPEGSNLVTIQRIINKRSKKDLTRFFDKKVKIG